MWQPQSARSDGTSFVRAAVALAVAIGASSSTGQPARTLAAAPQVPAAAVAGPGSPGLSRIPWSFTENRGQQAAGVSYYVERRDGSIYFTERGITFALIGQPTSAAASGRGARHVPSESGPRADYALKLDFVDANRAVRPAGRDAAPGVVNYLTGPREKWRTGLRTYSTLAYENLWPGIDLIYSGTTTGLKYQFVVKPGVAPDAIALAYRGATSVSVNAEGQLEVQTPVRRLLDDKPYTYQEVDGRRVDVASSYVVEPAAEGAAVHRYRFRIGAYDPARALIIDPAILFYSGFLGGSEGGTGHGIAVDAEGSAYVTGLAGSTDFPVTPGAYVTPGGLGDVFVTKIRSDGEALLYSTRFGGGKFDVGVAIALHGKVAYVTGRTSSADFPTTATAFDTSYNGPFPKSDAFVTTLNDEGTDILYSTFFGGSVQPAGEVANGIAVSKTGQAYITGFTSASNLPIKSPIPGAMPPFQPNQPAEDAFVAMFDPALAGNASLVYSTYLGGSANDYGNAIALAANGTAWVAGSTSSTNFPTVNPIFGDTFGEDGFVAQVNPFGTGLVYSTYLGGSQFDLAYAITVGPAGSVYVAGSTNSADFPVSAGAFDTTNTNVESDAFVTKLTAAGALVYSTFLGGDNGWEDGWGIAVDASGKAYVTGPTASSDFPTVEAIMLDRPGDDVFVAKLNASGSALVYSTYLGGSGLEWARSIDVGRCGRAYVTGQTGSTFFPPFPTTPDAWDTTFNSTLPNGEDAFALRLDDPGADLSVVKLASPDPVHVGDILTYNVIVTNNGSTTAHNVWMIDALPQHVTLVSVEVPAGGSWIDWGDHISPTIGHVLQANLGMIKCGDKLRVRIRVKPTVLAKGKMINFAGAGADELDPDPSDNTAQVVTLVVP